MKLICSLILELILAVLVLAMTGCGSTFYSADGKPAARICGDYTYQKTPDGSVLISLRHTETIQATGNALAKDLGALGTAATALTLTH